MGKVLGIIAAGICFFAFHWVWWLALAVGAGIWIWMWPSAESTVMIQTIDLRTGRTILQPQDKAAMQYLASRPDNQN